MTRRRGPGGQKENGRCALQTNVSVLDQLWARPPLVCRALLWVLVLGGALGKGEHQLKSYPGDFFQCSSIVGREGSLWAKGETAHMRQGV